MEGEPLMKANEQDDTATPRAGGDVIWKGPSQAPPADSDAKSNTASPEAPESETRAAMDVLTKGASQNESGESQ